MTKTEYGMWVAGILAIIVVGFLLKVARTFILWARGRSAPPAAQSLRSGPEDMTEINRLLKAIHDQAPAPKELSRPERLQQFLEDAQTATADCVQIPEELMAPMTMMEPADLRRKRLARNQIHETIMTPAEVKARVGELKDRRQNADMEFGELLHELRPKITRTVLAWGDQMEKLPDETAAAFCERRVAWQNAAIEHGMDIAKHTYGLPYLTDLTKDGIAMPAPVKLPVGDWEGMSRLDQAFLAVCQRIKPKLP